MFIGRYSPTCLYVLALATVWNCGAVYSADPVRVMSFNIRYGKANDGENHWQYRKDYVVQTVRDFSPDLLGTQETLKFQADYLIDHLEGYTYFGRSRMKTPNEHCGILYRNARFTQLSGGHFWLSESPETPESISWDSSLPRMASWVLLHDKTQNGSAPILFVNTHFDHRGRDARHQSAILLQDRVRSLVTIADEPRVIVTGDFNTAENSSPYQALLTDDSLLRDTYRVFHPEPKPDEGTFNGWKGTKSGGRIDWILASPTWKVAAAEILDRDFDGHYPSDHFPVTAILEGN